MGEIDLDALVLVDQIDRIMQRGQHAKTQQIEFDQTHGGTVVLVPLQDGPILHPTPFHRAHLGNGSVADHHSTGMDTEVPGEILDLRGQVEDIGGNGMFDTAAAGGGILDLRGQR